MSAKENILNGTITSRYMLLARLIMDCKNYVKEGRKSMDNLYGKDVMVHLELMRDIRNSLPENKKPVWLTERQMNEYEKAMLIS